MKMILKLVIGILLLPELITCDDFLILNLADGGTSSPIKLMPGKITDSKEKKLEEYFDNINDKNMTINLHNKRDLNTESSIFEVNDSANTAPNIPILITTEHNSILPDHDKTTKMITTIIATTQQKEPTISSTKPSSNIPLTVSSNSINTVSHESPEGTTINATESTYSVSNESPEVTTAINATESTYTASSKSPEVTTPINDTESCHKTCRNDVEALHLYQLQPKLTLPVDSNLTLLCELPLTRNFTLENILWLYEAERAPECSLTSQESIQSCTGFQVIHNEDDRNETFLRETLHLTGLGFNNTGNFICQAEVTCCQNTNEQNVIIKREMLHVNIWHSDYTVDLAIMGSVAAVMTLAVAVISFLISRRRRRIAYVAIDNENIQVKPTTVLHMPVPQYDDDNDSFDSQFDD